MNIPIVTALFHTKIYTSWAEQHSLQTSFQDELGTGDLTCVIKITPAPPWTPITIREEINDQVLALVKELRVCGFDLQVLGRARCVGTSVYVRLY